VLKKKVGENWSKEIAQALLTSQNYVLLCTSEAINSNWVVTEYETFYNACYITDPNNRFVYIILPNNTSDNLIPLFLKRFEYASEAKGIIQSIFKNKISKLKLDYEILNDNFECLNAKFKKEQKHFLYNKFWSPIVSENREVHIITCARDAFETENRGPGGRTNIDKWDYTTVLEITHFLARKYPQTKVIIEPPKSKLSTVELKRIGKIESRDNIISSIRNMDCIIVGSPDVSDFAEIILAKLHIIEPYNNVRLKKKGYVIIKNKKNLESSFYWLKNENEFEGVAKIKEDCTYDFFKTKNSKKNGEMFGILVIANNPFCDEGNCRKIIILSGFSGIATYAIAKFLTDDKYQEQLSRFDNDYIDRNRNIEVVIGVKYVIDDLLLNKDNREILEAEDAIYYSGYSEI
jgi:hypothetical protein